MSVMRFRARWRRFWRWVEGPARRGYAEYRWSEANRQRHWLPHDIHLARRVDRWKTRLDRVGQ